MKINNIPNWVPLASLAALTLIGWGKLTADVENIDERQDKVDGLIEQSIKNEADIQSNVRGILLLGDEVKDTQEDIQRTQDKLDQQQRDIINLLRRRLEER